MQGQSLMLAKSAPSLSTRPLRTMQGAGLSFFRSVTVQQGPGKRA